MKKNEEYIVDIEDNGFQGEGIAKKDDFTLFIPNCIKGEKVKVKVLKVGKKIAFGKVIEVIEKSHYRKEIDCEYFPKCGGCNLRHIDYDYTIEMKKKSVENTLAKAIGRSVEIDDIIKMDSPYYYRNKLQYPVGIDKNGNPVMGIFREKSHDIIEVKKCLIQDEKNQEIANELFLFIKNNNIPVYDEKSREGSIRHIIVRSGKKTGEVMIIIVSNTDTIVNEETESKLVKHIVSKYPEVKVIAKSINKKNTNVILGNKVENIYGEGYIEDKIGECRFKISPLSFYQVNPIQTEKLYNKAIEYAQLCGNEIIFDLYCGIGTIGICASMKAKKLYGIECIDAAIKNARENAKINNIENAEFFAGNVEDFLPDFISKNKIKPDIVFIDPPRKGCENSALETILEIEPEKIVYVSCNPATLGRDLKKLEEKYEIKKVAICDMFPWTSHCESITALERKN